ncbi:hypothetical protein ON010_g18677 [Phytophthora cinnamomi]|nr:hypothetical protein ON010_g18677 [Phytophthora cinnamomi]
MFLFLVSLGLTFVAATGASQGLAGEVQVEEPVPYHQSATPTSGALSPIGNLADGPASKVLEHAGGGDIHRAADAKGVAARVAVCELPDGDGAGDAVLRLPGHLLWALHERIHLRLHHELHGHAVRAVVHPGGGDAARREPLDGADGAGGGRCARAAHARGRRRAGRLGRRLQVHHLRLLQRALRHRQGRLGVHVLQEQEATHAATEAPEAYHIEITAVTPPLSPTGDHDEPSFKV